MGLHLYVRDENDRGTEWNCTTEEMLQHTTGCEPLQVLAPVFFNLFTSNPRYF